MSKDGKGKKGKGRNLEVRSKARNWVPDEAGGPQRFDTRNRQGKEPVYTDLPGLRNTAYLQSQEEGHPYASDGEGRQYEYVVRQAMPQGGKFKDEDGNKYRETWEYVGSTPEERQFRGDDSFMVGGDDVWRRSITPINKQKNKQPAPQPTAAVTPAATPGASASPAPASTYIQPGPTTTQVPTGEQFLNDYMQGAIYPLDTTPVYHNAMMGSIYGDSTMQVLPPEEEEALAWYDMPY